MSNRVHQFPASAPPAYAEPIPPKKSLLDYLKGEPLRIIVVVLVALEAAILNAFPGLKASAVSQVVIIGVTALLGELARANVVPVSKLPAAEDQLAHVLSYVEQLGELIPDPQGLAGHISDAVIQGLNDVLTGFQQAAGGPVTNVTVVNPPSADNSASSFDPVAVAAAVFGPNASVEPTQAPAYTNPRPDAPVAPPSEGAPVSASLLSIVLDETPGDGGRLGRNIEHDPRSRDFPVAEAAPKTLTSVLWTRRVPPFDQGDIGSCTGNAAAGVVATDNSVRQGKLSVVLPGAVKYFNLAAGEHAVDEELAVAIYTLNTRLDSYPGAYPAQDTGSSGLAAAKSLVKLGLASGAYKHAFSLSGLTTALQQGPAMIGIPWYSGFDKPDTKTGVVKLSGTVRGGHEIEVIGWDKDTGYFTLPQSWGESWTKFVPHACAGKGGYFQISTPDMTRVLKEQGDSTFVLAD